MINRGLVYLRKFHPRKSGACGKEESSCCKCEYTTASLWNFPQASSLVVFIIENQHLHFLEFITPLLSMKTNLCSDNRGSFLIV